MTDRELDVGVVGAGFAGMAAALFLAKDGHRVTLYERAAKPGPVGAAIVLQPSGLAVLRRLGVDRDVGAKSGRIDRLQVRSPKGRLLIDLDYAAIDPRWYGLGVGRGVLFDALYALVTASRRIAVRTGAEVAGAKPVDGGHRLAHADGSELGRHQLVVAADGSRSRVALSIPGRELVPYPWGALFYVGACPDDPVLRQVADGARRFVGVLPMGQGRASLFWSLRADRQDEWRKRFTSWREEALRLAPHASPLIEAMRAPEDVLFAPYCDVRMKRWHAPGLVAIGDAAHATSPQLGQGTNLALIDALVLADAVRAHGLDGLPLYADRRRRQLAYYQRATRWLTPFFQSDSRALGWLRDLGFPIARRIGPIRRLMSASMAGVAAGFFGRREPLVSDWP